MTIIRLRSPHGYEAALENQKLFSADQREMAINSPHLAFYVIRRGSLSTATRRRIFERDGGRCVHCECALDCGNFHVDHLLAIARGGSDHDDNLAASCPPCNLAKGAN